jgi:hypothetical protein
MVKVRDIDPEGAFYAQNFEIRVPSLTPIKNYYHLNTGLEFWLRLYLGAFILKLLERMRTVTLIDCYKIIYSEPEASSSIAII